LDNDQQSELAKIVDELLMLVRESADFQTDDDVRSALLEASRAIATLRRRLAIVSDRYIVAVVGLTNVGKSTLLNALLGAELAPRRNGPCTAAPIEFASGDSLRVTVYHQRSLTRPTWRCPNVEAVHDRLAAVADDAGDLASREIRKVVVEAPIPLLTNGLVIADTPGFGAAQIAEAAGSHEAALKKYLQDDVSQVFWVVLAEQGIGKREKSFHDAFFGEVCDDVIVTGCDDWEAHDKERFQRRFAETFQSRMPRFHFVSGLQGMRARKAADSVGLEAAGITLLETRIRELIDRPGRVAAIQDSLLQLTADLRCWLSEYRDARRGRLKFWWRPDSWSRWSACMPESAIKKRLSAELGANL
jgi:GTP-binding protein EngB required for normal cell division